MIPVEALAAAALVLWTAFGVLASNFRELTS